MPSTKASSSDDTRVFEKNPTVLRRAKAIRPHRGWQRDAQVAHRTGVSSLATLRLSVGLLAIQLGKVSRCCHRCLTENTKLAQERQAKHAMAKNAEGTI